nr:unnamed protein product [Callosobruchus analis]
MPTKNPLHPEHIFTTDNPK